MRYNSIPQFTVLGAGNGGQALAAILASKKLPVALWNRSASTIEAINKKGGIKVSGKINGFFKPDLVTSDIKEAILDADVIMVVTTADAHRTIAHLIAPYLRDGQIIVLNPGRTGGALEVRKILTEYGLSKNIIVAEAQTLIYISRAIEPGKVNLVEIKNECPVSALPATETPKVIQLLQLLHKEFVPAPNVLSTSINNIGCIFHPAPLLLNAARVEDPNVDYDHYIDGISPSIGAFLERMDEERVAIGHKFGINVISALEWVQIVYDSPNAKNLYEIFQNTRSYEGIKAPNTLKHRYIYEDVPTGLVGLSSLGKIVNVPTPCIDAFVNFVCAFYGINFWEKGRTCESLGLLGMTAEEILSYVETGKKIHNTK